VFLVLVFMTPVLGDDGPRVRYDDHKLVEVMLEAESHIDTILSISDDPWSDGVGVGTFDSAWRRSAWLSWRPVG